MLRQKDTVSGLCVKFYRLPLQPFNEDYIQNIYPLKNSNIII